MFNSHSIRLAAFSLLFYLFPLCWTLPNGPCPLLGPDVPAPTSPSSSNAIRQAKQDLTRRLNQALHSATAYGKLDAETNSFALDVWSLHEPGSLYNYSHIGTALPRPSAGVSTIDQDTIFRIGSLSKLFTVYTYLVTAGDLSWHDPITKYIPELEAYMAKNEAALEAGDTIDVIQWDQITVGALAGQLGGVPREFAFGPVVDAELQQAIGLPVVAPVSAAFCGDPQGLQTPCNRSAFFADYLVQRPVVAPFSTPIYANPAYQLLTYALENMTSSSFPDIFAQNFVNRLGLNSTHYFEPPTASAYIPFNVTASGFATDLRDETPAGGYYSSLQDMQAIGRSILNFSHLSPAQTRRWMKPGTFTAGANTSVGAPWEILRAPNPALTSWLYTKGGDLGLYTSEFVLMPEYDAGFNVLTAGLNGFSQVQIISDILAEVLHPAFEGAAKQETKQNYAGRYSADIDGVNTTLIVGVDQDPGLQLTQWIYNGTDMLTNLGSILLNADSVPSAINARLYPTNLVRRANGTITQTSWRVTFQIPPTQPEGTFLGGCDTWLSVDAATYGGVGIDEFVFDLSEDGSAVAIEPRVLRLKVPLVD